MHKVFYTKAVKISLVIIKVLLKFAESSSTRAVGEIEYSNTSVFFHLYYSCLSSSSPDTVFGSRSSFNVC